MKELKINHLAVVIIVVIGQLIPMGWYGLLAKPWMAYNELTMEYIQANQSTTPYIVSIIQSFITAYALAWIFTKMRIESAISGLIAAVVMGFAFNLLPSMTQNLFSFRPYELTWIDGGVNLIIFAIAGVILGAWRKYKE